jgi:hypothetical protein
MKKIFFFLCVISAVAACSSSKIKTSEEKLVEVSFGNYGGFSNSSTEYILTGDGQLSKVNGNSLIPLKRVQNKKVREIKNQLKSMEFEKLLVNDLGNLTYFIKVKTSKNENTVRWNDETQNIELINTYKMLIEILQ